VTDFLFYLFLTVFSEFNLYPHGFLYDLWMKFHDMYISRQDMPGSSGQSQVMMAKNMCNIN